MVRFGPCSHHLVSGHCGRADAYAPLPGIVAANVARVDTGDRYAPGMLSTGQPFAGYTILRLLGAGGMGEVYLAQHPRLPRQDALKILSAAVSADNDFRARFIREADLAAALSHSNIVAIYDRGEVDGQLWISMQYVKGTDAAQLVHQRYPTGMPAEEATPIIAAVAGALDYAHRESLLHRDVKPANILLTDPDIDGQRRALLADFGIARALSDPSGLTATNITVGTVSYAAPEQLMGEEIDSRADQYSLAATAFHLLTGAPPYQNTNPAAVIGQHLNAAIPKLSERRPDLMALDAVLAVALSKEPANRFPRCVDFAQAVAVAVHANAPFAATQQAPAVSAPLPPPTTTRAVASRRPGRATITLLTLLALALVAALVFVGLQLRGTKQSAPPQTDPPASTSAAASPPPPTSPSPTSAPPTMATSTVSPTTGAPAAVDLPISYGHALISTPSGKTICQVDIEYVGCESAFTFRTPPSECSGTPSNIISLRANGSIRWSCGNLGGARTFTTLSYGTTYRALGWTILSTSQGTTFTNTATGHGMFVSVEQVRLF
ncbi:hypothetical protein NGTWS0302_16730 [Mycolicibacterium cyprinidarum]|uniref:non-specific serine/threonine protein kinase n=1 Tax=Mycolicibacterium cyprinidarum TaxID=2860311 RepID=A0ABQ4VBF6_9MYCO|nr:hypothetical protein NGTWS1702_24820 [Mycolicibacterium sp. NGTWSNA01]GJF18486.1 hypothetical protein NGTWS0302_16730 [Mycolicibacterium sp. NGTWS0302]